MNKIGVGIIGANHQKSWAARAHVPALNALEKFEFRALSTSSQVSADAAGRAFGLSHCFDNHMDLIRYPGVDLVVVAVKVPHHHELVTAALENGKAVYCEWPLGNGLEEAERLDKLATSKRLHNLIGLQARCAASVNYVRDLVRDGYLGEVLSTTLVGSGMQWGSVVDQSNAYLADNRNGATMLTIPFGHTVDALCYCLGEFEQLSAGTTIRRNKLSVVETGELIDKTAADQIAVTGTLANGVFVNIHYRGGQSRGVNLLWEINGSEGDLQITAGGGHAQIWDLVVRGGRGEERVLSPMPIPDRYHLSSVTQGPAANVANLYARYASALESGETRYPTFADALCRHKMLAAVEESADTGRIIRLG